MEMVPYQGRHIAVITADIAGGQFYIRQLGVWSEIDGRRGYTKITPPERPFDSSDAAHAHGVSIAKGWVDGGLA